MNQKEPVTIRFEYKISPGYAVYAATGVHGGPNAQGDIVMSFFNERAPIPKHQTHRVLPDGSLEEPPVDQELKPGAIRDVFFGVSISPATARAVAGWLTRLVEAMEKDQAQTLSLEKAGDDKPKPH